MGRWVATSDLAGSAEATGSRGLAVLDEGLCHCNCWDTDGARSSKRGDLSACNSASRRSKRSSSAWSRPLRFRVLSGRGSGKRHCSLRAYVDLSRRSRRRGRFGVPANTRQLLHGESPLPVPVSKALANYRVLSGATCVHLAFLVRHEKHAERHFGPRGRAVMMMQACGRVVLGLLREA